jgi:hypothetical protein
MNRNHIVLDMGLGSSIFRRWRRWALTLGARLSRHYAARIGRDIIIHVVSSDGNREKAATRAILADRAAGRLGEVALVGHSNGCRDNCAMSRDLFPTPIIYAANIDMTLDNREPMHGNVKYFEEFWAGLAKDRDGDGFVTKFHPGFIAANPPRKFYDLDRILGRDIGHTPAAEHPFTQGKIFGAITARIP